MRRISALALCLSITALAFASSTNATGRTLVLRPGQSKRLTPAVRGDTVRCGDLRLTVQRTPMVIHVPGESHPLFASRSAYSNLLTLTISSRFLHVVEAICTHR